MQGCHTKMTCTQNQNKHIYIKPSNLFIETHDKASSYVIPFHLSRPAKLVEIMKERFISSGGAIYEGKSLSSISVHDDLAVSTIYFSPWDCKNIVSKWNIKLYTILNGIKDIYMLCCILLSHNNLPMIDLACYIFIRTRVLPLGVPHITRHYKHHKSNTSLLFLRLQYI